MFHSAEESYWQYLEYWDYFLGEGYFWLSDTSEEGKSVEVVVGEVWSLDLGFDCYRQREESENIEGELVEKGGEREIEIITNSKYHWRFDKDDIQLNLRWNEIRTRRMG